MARQLPQGLLVLVLLLLLAPPSAHTLHAYGHAFSRPMDFTDAQITAVAARFEIFTVEKGCSVDRYGSRSSIAATIGTAKRIKAVNPAVQVLMYWNAAMHYNMYECEASVQPSWVIPGPNGHAESYYNYSVPEFRTWWVKCAVDAVTGSQTLLDGVFLDATPKVADGQCSTPGPEAQRYWNGMVDQIRSALGDGAVVIDNGFYLAGKYPKTKQLAGADAWEHSGTAYTESVSSVGPGVPGSPLTPDALEQAVQHLRWIANASASHPDLRMIGHGSINVNSTAYTRTPATAAAAAAASSNNNTAAATGGADVTGLAGLAAGALDPVFEFGLAKYLLVTSSVEKGWFLANHNYGIDGGLLQQPMSVYTGAGVGCGEPTSAFVRPNPKRYVLTRTFEHGTVDVDVESGTGVIKCGGGK